MTLQEAYIVLENSTSHVKGTRADHVQIADALKLIKELIDKQNVDNG